MAAEEQPSARRPDMPGYGMAAVEAGAGLLPWSWAEERLSVSHNYWLATTRPDGRPHVMPLWGVWLDGAFCFSTGATSRKARNLAADPRCTITTERADEAVIVEGEAAPLAEMEVRRRFVRGYKEKYGWEMDGAGEGIYTLRPRVAFAFIEAADQFGLTPTRWSFGAE